MYPGIAPAMIVNIAASNKEELKASRRPMISADRPQIAAPARRPIWDARAIPFRLLFGLPYCMVTAGIAIL